MKNTNTQLKLAAVALMAGLYGTSAVAASLNMDATATILDPVVLAAGANMDFGTIASGANATTVSVSAAGTVTAPAGAGNAVVTNSAGAAMTFDVTAANGIAYVLSIADGVLDTAAGAATTMTVTNFGDDASLTGTGAVETVTVTADLLVGANQEGGAYSTANDTAIAITADYQ